MGALLGDCAIEGDLGGFMDIDKYNTIMSSLSTQSARQQLIKIVCRDIRSGDVANAEYLLGIYLDYWRKN